ncbi:multiple monosaccharide ABC transporter substrate-binding protein [Kitasatospora misakiensis]|uniref:Multiple monosaccharide ABC transporter substrate-binding protein n=1 Tax=Kitasatospora misakiensis TaxID=67330 RepID=A0ABW0WXV3_9ACTN
MRKISAGLVATGLLLSLAACGQSANGVGGDASAKGDAKGGLVGIAMPTKSSERWINDGNNIVKEFQAKGYKTDLQFGDNVVENQVSQVENMITKGAKLLVIAAIDGASLTNVLQKAADSHIPVIAYDRLIRGTQNVDYYATFDNYKVGVLQGSYIVDKLGLKDGKGPFNIELFAGSPDDNNSSYFFNGAMSVLKPYLDDKKLVVQSGQTEFNQVATLRWDGGVAQSRMDNLLSKAYTSARVDAVLSPYDGISIGIISSLKGVGYGSGKSLPVITGQDAELASVKSIIAGEQTMSIYKDARLQAKVTAQMGDALLTGGKPEVNDTTQYNNGVKVVPAQLLQPVLVDKDSYQKALIDSGQYTADQLK